MIRLSAEAAGSARVRSANWIGFLSAGPTRLAPLAITTVNNATIASRTMLQFSSRTFMPEKRGKWGLVPAAFSPAESASGEAESERHHVVSQKRKPRLGGAGFSWGSGMGDRCASKISRGSHGKVQKQKPHSGMSGALSLEVASQILPRIFVPCGVAPRHKHTAPQTHCRP